MSKSEVYAKGDHVTIGAYGKVHWEVEHAYFPAAVPWTESEQHVILVSPMSGRRTSQLARYIQHWQPEARDLAQGV